MRVLTSQVSKIGIPIPREFAYLKIRNIRHRLISSQHNTRRRGSFVSLPIPSLQMAPQIENEANLRRAAREDCYTATSIDRSFFGQERVRTNDVSETVA